MARGDARLKRIALTVAGSDSGGGAGIQADLKTFAALGVYGASAITALTAQNTRGVSAIHLTPPEMVVAQIEAVLSDFDVAAVKIGMLGSAEIAAEVARAFSFSRNDSANGVSRPDVRRPFLIYDPVMAASSGDALSSAGLRAAIRAHILPRLDCLTPNLAEAAVLLETSQAHDEAGMIRQGRALIALGPRAALMKGGHLEGDAVDLLVLPDATHRFAAPRIASRNLHGTGCTLSSAIAAHVALGRDLVNAVHEAKVFTRRAIEQGRGVVLGTGAGPLLQIPLC